MGSMACVILTGELIAPERATGHISVQCMPLPASSSCPKKTFTLIHWTSTHDHIEGRSTPWLGLASQTQSWAFDLGVRSREEQEGFALSRESTLALLLIAISWAPSARWPVGAWPRVSVYALLPSRMLSCKHWSSCEDGGEPTIGYVFRL